MSLLDPTALTTIALAGTGAASAALIYVLRLEGRMTAHEQTDIVIHANVANSLIELKASGIRMEEKIDRLIERFSL